MALAADGAAPDELTGPIKPRLTRVPSGRDQQWLLTVLPAFPLLLLVLRLWYLSRQNMQTMLLLVPYVSPLGLVSALLITLVWVLPVSVLLCRALGALLWLSAASRLEALRSRLTRTALRMPDWVVVLAVLLAALTWQLRFLPTLLMITLMILGLAVRDRYGARRRMVRTVCVGLPIVAALLVYLWVLPAGWSALRGGEGLTAVLLLGPPAVTALLTGPVPAYAARWVTHRAAVAGALLAPVLIGTIFLRAPILPTVAVEVAAAGRPSVDVVIGYVIAVDDRVTTVLEPGGAVRFVPNGQVRSQTLCPGAEELPAGTIEVHGWHVERTALDWIAPRRAQVPDDPRCQGRPITPG